MCMTFWYVYAVGVRVVFFFKQKTAYEMRISDWSSDVCSSDLHATPPIVQPFASAMFAASTKSDTRIFATGAPMPTVRLPFSQRPSAHVRACRAGLSLHSYVLSLSAR